MLDSNWKVAALVGALILFRVVVGSWRKTPHQTFLLELANSALVAFALVFLLIRPFLLQAFFIPSPSMENTLLGPGNVVVNGQVTHRQGDRILVNRFSYRLGPPRRGDIVVFEAPPQAIAAAAHGATVEGQADGVQDWVKRVIGLPGERIQVVAGTGVYVNNRLLHESYIKEIPNQDFPTDPFGVRRGAYLVPPGCVFVMGDNRNNSTDSRFWFDRYTHDPQPELPIKNILGRSMIIFWPLNRIGTLTR